MSKIEYISVEEASKLWGLSIRSVRNSCAQGRVPVKNQIGGTETVRPEDVATEMKTLLADYNSKSEITFDDILDFHVRFESIHPIQDGNGRVCRLIMFKECLKHNIVPFIITEELKMFYYRGFKEWKNE